MSAHKKGASRFQAKVHQNLLDRALHQTDINRRWLLLEAAHVVGQDRLVLHARTHAQMLRLACITQDWTEVMGQIFRLLLVPIGHLTRRLPKGNTGRSTVSAFASMSIRPELQGLIEQARSQHQSETNHARTSHQG